MRSASEAALQQGHRKAQAEMQQEVQKANAVFYSINPSGPSIRLNVISTRAQGVMEQLAGEGMAIVFIASELEEVVRSSHRVVVLRDRTKIRELTGEEITEANVMHVIAGTK